MLFVTETNACLAKHYKHECALRWTVGMAPTQSRYMQTTPPQKPITKDPVFCENNITPTSITPTILPDHREVPLVVAANGVQYEHKLHHTNTHQSQTPA
jgi:hypothetical protein